MVDGRFLFDVSGWCGTGGSVDCAVVANSVPSVQLDAMRRLIVLKVMFALYHLTAYAPTIHGAVRGGR
jgi:hypothetical protein